MAETRTVVLPDYVIVEIHRFGFSYPLVVRFGVIVRWGTDLPVKLTLDLINEYHFEEGNDDAAGDCDGTLERLGHKVEDTYPGNPVAALIRDNHGLRENLVVLLSSGHEPLIPPHKATLRLDMPPAEGDVK